MFSKPIPILVQVAVAISILAGLFIPQKSHAFLFIVRCILLNLPTVVFFAWVLIARTSESHRYAWSIAVAFAFSLAGSLLLPLPGLFVAGVSAYLIANLAYLTAFTSGVRLARRITPFLVFGSIAVIVLGLAWSGIPPKFRVLIVLYCLTIVSVPAQALTRSLVLQRVGCLLAAIGAALLLISDAAIAITGFRAPTIGQEAFILLTYFGGQWLITASVVQAAPEERTGLLRRG